jgi:hypothetical protein
MSLKANGPLILAGAIVFANLYLVYASKSSSSLLGFNGGSTETKSKIQPWPKTGNPHILVAGGAGYIGTHTIVTLIEDGYDVTVIDNLVNSNEESLNRVKEITKCDPSRIRFYNVDMYNLTDLEEVFKTSQKFQSCIHFAGLKVHLPFFSFVFNFSNRL